MKKLRTYISGYILFSGILFYIFEYSPQVAESLYGSFFYPIIKWILWAVFSFVPIPFYYIVWPGILLGVILILALPSKSGVWYQKLLRKLWYLLYFFGFAMATFYWCWGFNYSRTSFVEKAELEVSPVSDTTVFLLFEKTVDELNLQKRLQPTSRLEWESKNIVLLNESLKEVLSSFKYKTTVPIAVRSLKPKGILMRWSAAGIYMPYSGESNVDAALLDMQMPSVVSHELSHAYGITDEGVANFIAFLTCLNSAKPEYVYSGWLSLYPYIASAAYRMDKDRYQMIKEKLDAEVISDMEAIRENGKKYPDWIPEWKDVVYDGYLKSQGVKAGTKSYSQMVMLVGAYQVKRNNILN